MTEQELDKWVNDIINELIVYNKIKVNVKNIWAEKLHKYLTDERDDWNEFQNRKVLKVIPNLNSDAGITELLELIKRTNSQLETRQLTVDTVKKINYSVLWDKANTDAKKKQFIKSFSPTGTPPATKWVIREWMKGADYNENEIRKVLGKPF